jgi:hypothetical protein
MASSKKYIEPIEQDIITAWQNAEGKITFTQFIESIKDVVRSNSSFSRDLSKDKSWKNDLIDMFSGRGNCWLYYKLDSPVIEKINSAIDSFESNGDNVKMWRYYTEQAGYVWLRYESVRGNASNPVVRFELRIKDTRNYDKDHMISLTPEEIELGEILGNSPLGLKFTDERKKKSNDNDLGKKERVKKSDSTVWKSNPEIGTVINSSRGKVIITGNVNDK